MSLDRFRLFASVAKHLSFTKASREKRISQPAISRQLKILQEEFGVRLFNKKGRGVELTDSGRIFFSKVTSILLQVEELKTIALPAENTGSLSIAGCRGPCAVVLPSLMAQFRESHPFVKITLYSGNSSRIRPWLRDSIVDVGVITSPPNSPSFHVEPYRVEKLTTFISPQHPFAAKPISDFEKATIPLIVRAGTPTPTRTEKEISAFESKGIGLLISMRCGSTEAVKQAVACGAGVGVLYHDAVKRDLERGEFKPMKIPSLSLKRQSYIVYPKGKPLSAAATEFLRLLRNSKTKLVSCLSAFALLKYAILEMLNLVSAVGFES